MVESLAGEVTKSAKDREQGKTSGLVQQGKAMKADERHEWFQLDVAVVSERRCNRHNRQPGSRDREVSRRMSCEQALLTFRSNKSDRMLCEWPVTHNHWLALSAGDQLAG